MTYHSFSVIRFSLLWLSLTQRIEQNGRFYARNGTEEQRLWTHAPYDRIIERAFTGFCTQQIFKIENIQRKYSTNDGNYTLKFLNRNNRIIQQIFTCWQRISEHVNICPKNDNDVSRNLHRFGFRVVWPVSGNRRKLLNRALSCCSLNFPNTSSCRFRTTCMHCYAVSKLCWNS